MKKRKHYPPEEQNVASIQRRLCKYVYDSITCPVRPARRSAPRNRPTSLRQPTTTCRPPFQGLGVLDLSLDLSSTESVIAPSRTSRQTLRELGGALFNHSKSMMTVDHSWIERDRAAQCHMCGNAGRIVVAEATSCAILSIRSRVYRLSVV